MVDERRQPNITVKVRLILFGLMSINFNTNAAMRQIRPAIANVRRLCVGNPCIYESRLTSGINMLAFTNTRQ